MDLTTTKKYPGGTLTITMHPARGTERTQHSIGDTVGWVSARLYGRTDEEAEVVRAVLEKPADLFIAQSTEAMVRLAAEHSMPDELATHWMLAVAVMRRQSTTIAELTAQAAPRVEVDDATIEAALDQKFGIDNTLRQLIRGDTIAVGYSKADVVRGLLRALGLADGARPEVGRG